MARDKRIDIAEHQLPELPDYIEQSVRQAHAFLMRGVGLYRPPADLIGVDEIEVRLVRPFGCVETTIHGSRIEFEQLWRSAADRRKLHAALDGASVIDPDDKEWHLRAYIDRAQKRIRDQRYSADYQVVFQGMAGTWAYKFSIGALSFDRGMITPRRPVTDWDD